MDIDNLTLEELRQLVIVQDKLIEERDRLLNLFECPQHGQCVPFAIEEVARLRKIERDSLFKNGLLDALVISTKED